MEYKDFLYSIYNKELVDKAMEETTGYLTKLEFDNDIKQLFKEFGGDVDDPGDAFDKYKENIYKRYVNTLTYSFLDGVKHSVKSGQTETSILPSEISFSDFRKNVDFAVMFYFSDNDFSSSMEAAAKQYCDAFNDVLRSIDIYKDASKNTQQSYIDDFNELCKPDSIKEIMKCGFMADRMRKFGTPICSRIPKSSNAIEEVQKTLNYIKWDEDCTRWEKVGDKYVESGKMKRFITGTAAEITEALKDYGSPYDMDEIETIEDVYFPVWCNGEVIVMFMKDGYLTYVTR